MIAVCILLIGVDVAVAQSTTEVTLPSLYEQLEVNYPVASKPEIQQKITDIQQQLSQTGWFPEVKLNGSISYQSEVTEVAFAPTAPEFSKDHYNIGVELNQPLYEAGRVSKTKFLNEVQGKTAEAGIEVDMNNLRSQLDQIYFGILNARKQLAILNSHTETLDEQLRWMKALVQNEVQLPGNQYVIEAEILNVRQQKIQVKASIKAGMEALGILTGTTLDAETPLAEPKIDTPKTEFLSRPEFEVFGLQQQSLDAQLDLTQSDKLPVVSAFGTANYGRPGYNAFDNDLHFFWMVGVRAQWSFRNWRNTDKKSQVIALQKNQLVADEEAFTRQLESSIANKTNVIEGLTEQIELDDQVLALRTKVVEEKQHQLEEGVITSTEYITELNAQNRASLNLELHKLQLVQANYELQRLRGNK